MLWPIEFDESPMNLNLVGESPLSTDKKKLIKRRNIFLNRWTVEQGFALHVWSRKRTELVVQCFIYPLIAAPPTTSNSQSEASISSQTWRPHTVCIVQKGHNSVKPGALLRIFKCKKRLTFYKHKQRNIYIYKY